MRGDAARRIHRVVERVLDAPQVRGASLSMGDAGIALALHTLAAARNDDRAARAARACMDRAIDALARDPMSPWLFDGYTGVAWVAHHLFGDGGAEIDAAVARVVRDRKAPHELYAGLAGLGIYALARPRAGLSGIVTGLGRIAVRDAEGTTWDTPLAMLPPGVLPPGAHHHYNLGIAHGLPGVLGMLALAYPTVADRPLRRGSRSCRAVSAALL
ncbi:MAG TPA: lanthionine synthetase LanC family protein, partial [Kofleriaceae bacterium]